MSTPGPERVPSTVKVNKTSGQGKPPASGSSPTNSGGSKFGGGKQGGGKGGKGRKPVTPVKIGAQRNWVPIAVTAAVVLLAGGILAVAIIGSVKGPKTWQDKADAITGLVNYRKTDPELVKGAQHQSGTLQYKQSPPVAGPHNPNWQNCNGNVYNAQIPSEHAVHALEHGAVWITYKPDLPADQVQKLTSKVNGIEKMFMSPYPALDKNVSLQAWGYQLKVDSADDSRIDDFIRALRVNASIEGPTAPCDGGVTATGAVPVNAGAPMGK